MTASSARPTVASVRPVVLALAPPAPGVSHGTTLPCLETLGGSRLIERLLGTLDEVGLPSAVLSSPPTMRSPRCAPSWAIGVR